MSEDWRAKELCARLEAHSARGWALRLRANVVHGLVTLVCRDRIAFMGAAVVRRMVVASRRARGVRLSPAEVRSAAGGKS